MTETHTTEETQLVQDSLNGDHQAFGQLYQKYVRAMYHICLRMTGKTEEAEDVLQDAFIRVYQNLGQFRGQSTLGAWIKRVVINTALNHLRNANRMTMDEWTDDHEVAVDTMMGQPMPAISTQQLHEAIQQLPDGCRTVLTLYQLEGYPHAEVAEILGITASTSKTQYRRAKLLLAGILKEKMKP